MVLFMHLIPLIIGPTCSGKTDFITRLANHRSIEVISVDSVNCYKHLDIGSAKPSLAIRKCITHHLIDIVQPWESYSVGNFLKDIDPIVKQILDRGNFPVAVGGSMLYAHALIHGIHEYPTIPRDIINQVKGDIERLGSHVIWDRLFICDPETAGKIHKNDKQRIERFYSLCLSENKTLKEIRTLRYQSSFQFKTYALANLSREMLYKKINDRFDQMIEHGLVEEVRSIVKINDLEKKALNSIGYLQINQHLKGLISLNQAINEAKKESRRLAKRQLTWIRGWNNISFLENGQEFLMWR
jgi:tRNA dimethylallyltransferase